jgi:putative ABC transport system permease protein
MRSPGFALMASLVLGVGLAATATLFALIDAVLLRPLPYHEPDRLVMLWETNPAQGRLQEGPSPGNVADWVARGDAFESLTAWMRTSMTLRRTDGATPVAGVQATRGFFDVFRRAPLLGRTFTPDEYDGTAWNVTNRFVGRGEPILVLSHGLWRELGADPSIVGRTIHVEGLEWRVLGVMPADFVTPETDAAFWTPWDLRASYRGDRFPNGLPRDFRFLRVAGRLRPGTTIESAAARMSGVASQLASEHPGVNAGWDVRLVPLAEQIVRGSRAELLLVFAAMFALLLLLAANLASLAVARASFRSRELAIRTALGAARSRVVRQLTAEAAIIATMSGALALVLTYWWIDAVVAFAPPEVPRLHEVRVDARVTLFVILAAVVLTMIFGLLPSLQGSAPSMLDLKEGSPGAGRRGAALRRVLVAGELAITVLLLSGAALLARSFAELQRVDPGFDPTNLLVMRITPDANRYRTGAQAAEYYQRILDQVRTVPAVTSAAAVTVLPMSSVGSDFDRPYWADGPRPSADRMPEADIRMATPSYFATLRRPLVGGREFTTADDAKAQRVVIVNEALARATWPGLDALGRTLILDYQRGPYPYLVVGIVKDALYEGPRATSRPEIFIPHAQNPYLVMNVILRTAVDPESVAQTARGYALRVDPDQPVHSITTMADLQGDAVAQDRFGTMLLMLFAVAGLVVAASGVYSVLSYTVARGVRRGRRARGDRRGDDTRSRPPLRHHSLRCPEPGGGADDLRPGRRRRDLAARPPRGPGESRSPTAELACGVSDTRQA